MKMRGRLKRWGRCSSPGHGQGCEVTHEIREASLTREQEKREWPAGLDGGSPWWCVMCDREFPSHQALTDHVERMH